MKTTFVNTTARLSLVALALTLPASLAAAPLVRVAATDVTDERSTDNFFSGLKVKVSLVGDIMADAKGVRSAVKTAVDDTGRSLVKKDEHEGPAEFDETSGSSPEITLEMLTPARSARTIRRITGTIEIFVPKRDPASRVLVDGVLTHTGVPLPSEGLRAEGMQVVAWNRDEYLAYKKKHDEAEKAAEKAAEKGGQDEGVGTALAKGFGEMFSKMFGGTNDMGPNDVTLTILDPKSRMVSVEFEDPSGKEIESSGVTTMGGNKTFSFDKPLPATARLRFFVLTPASVIKVPLTLSDVPLP